jgi:putative inorganic carbon (HCO3(-)) transporter
VHAVSDTRSRFLAALFALAVATGLLAGIDPRLGVALAMAVAFVTVVMADLSLGLCMYALLAFLNIVPDAGGSFISFDKIAGGLLALSWLAAVASRKNARRAFFSAHPQFSAVLLLFLAWTALSMTWSPEFGAAAQHVARYVLSAFLFLIVFTAVRTRQHVRWLLGAFVLASTLSGAYGLIAPPPPGEEDRLAGTIGEPNQLAAVLVAGFVIALALAATERGKPLLRIFYGCAAVLCLLTTFLTLSRAGLIALVLAMIAAVIVGGRWRAQVAVAGTLVVLSLVGFFAFAATPDQRDRVTQVGQGSTTGRSDIWTVGWRMVQAHPVRGVGVGQFESSSVHYLIAPGTIRRSDLIVDQPKVAHNIYLHILAEMGVVGLSLFLLILGFALRCMLLAAREFGRRGDAAMDLISRAVFVGLIGILAADFFASEQFSKQLWLLLGIGPALLAIAQRRDEAEQPAEAGGQPAPAEPLAPQRLEPHPVPS